jgi:hypothetical protein
MSNTIAVMYLGKIVELEGSIGLPFPSTLP